MLNSVNLVGRVVEEFSVEYTPNDMAIATFKVATNGRQNEAPQFHNVRVFGDLAKACAEYLAAGQQVAVTGRLVYNKWTDERYRDKDGKPLSRVQAIIIASNIQFGMKASLPVAGVDHVRIRVNRNL